MTTTEIIKDIIENHHGYLKQELPTIKNMTYKILKVHYDDCGEELTMVHRLFGRVANELELHLVKKQIVVMPLIWDYVKKPSDEVFTKVKKAVQDAENDNNLLVQIFDQLNKATNGYTMPASGCQTYEATYQRLKTLESEVRKYIEIERQMYKELFQ